MATAADSLPGPSTSRERPRHLQAVGEGAQLVPDTRRKHRKYRYRGQGYHKNERESSWRVEARRFLSGITLDGHLRPPVELQDKDTTLKQHISTISLEEGVKSNSDLQNSEKLHEMAANLLKFYSHHSPVKMALSRSHELGFDSSPFKPSTPVGRSVSVVEPTFTPVGHEQKRSSFQHVPHSKSMGSSVEGDVIHYYATFKKFPPAPLENNR